jgi:hypothetical protein
LAVGIEVLIKPTLHFDADALHGLELVALRAARALPSGGIEVVGQETLNAAIVAQEWLAARTHALVIDVDLVE